MQATTSEGVLRYDLVKTRHGKKYFARAVKENKDQSWMTVAASLVIQVTIGYFLLIKNELNLNQ